MKERDSIGDYLTGEKIETAMERLQPIVHRTPIITSTTTNNLVDKHVYFKMENEQKIGAFKARGASFKLMQLTADELSRGVITASAGNHAQAVALAASKLNTEAMIFMPESTPQAKVNATRNYGAAVVLTGVSFQEAYEASLTEQMQTGAVYIHPFDDYDVMAGQGTIAMEMLEEVPNIDTIIVPIGGGGLMSGVAVAAKHVNPEINVIGVQASRAAPMYHRFHHHSVNHYQTVETIAEGIAVKKPGKKTFPIIRKYVDDILTVTEEEIAGAILYMLERNKALVEGAGAAGLAALFAHHQSIKSEHCGIVMSGGNMDLSEMPTIQRLAANQHCPA